MFATEIKENDKKINLSKISTEPPKDVERGETEVRFNELGEKLFELQQLMYGAGTHSVLLVLQGRDCAGKDGSIKHVMGHFNPRGVIASSFGVPTKEELDHDFLWRVHAHTPAKGNVGIFNRSHYEDVLVVRVHDLVEKKIWKKRYDAINAFEDLLVDSGTLVVKVFLHISRNEQEERLLEREDDPTKAFKINPNDWKERDYWDEYTEAYEDVFKKTSLKDAPWYVVPADKKWFRNLCVAEILYETMKPHKGQWEKALEELGKEKRAELKAYRAGR